MTKDEQIEEMQAMIDGQQFTIEAQQERITLYKDIIDKLERYFVGYLSEKDRFIFDLYVKPLLEDR